MYMSARGQDVICWTQDYLLRKVVITHVVRKTHYLDTGTGFSGLNWLIVGCANVKEFQRSGTSGLTQGNGVSDR